MAAAKRPARATDATNARAHKTKTTPPRNWRTVFLRELAIDGNRRRAAEAAHVDHATVYRHRNSDPEFRAQWDAAIDQASEYLEDEAVRRAVEGVEEPLTCAKGLVYDADGNPIMMRKYSDSLMALLLKGAKPQKYRDNVQVNAKHEHSGPDGSAIPIRFFNANAALIELAAGSESDS